MQQRIILLCALIAYLFPYQKAMAQEEDTLQEVILITQNERLSYSLGVTIGSSIRSQGLDTIDYQIFIRAMQDAFEGNDLIISNKQADKFIQRYFLELKDKQYRQKIKEDRAFLDTNARKEAVEVLPSGLQYKVLKKGAGPKPRITDKVTVHYHCTTLEEIVVKSTIESSKPVSFRVNETIKGLTEALMNMRVGAKWRIWIPYDLAYGEAGTDKVPPYSTIVCVIELRSID